MSVFVQIGDKGPAEVRVPCTAVTGGHILTAGVNEVCDHHLDELKTLERAAYGSSNTLQVSRTKPESEPETADEAKAPDSKLASSSPPTKALTTEALKGDEKKELVPVAESFKEKEA